MRKNQNNDLAQSGTSESGNTGSDSRVKQKKYRCTVFTIYKDEHKNSLSTIRKVLAQYFLSFKNCKFAMGIEICPSTGREHIQGYAACEHAKYWLSWFTSLGMHPHLQIAKKDMDINAMYCTKDDDFITNIYLEKPTIIKEENLRNWQKNILCQLKNEIPDDRTINWLYDKNGNIGKSVLAKYCKFYEIAEWITGGKGSDIKNLLLTSKKSRDIIIDIPRCNKDVYISYSVIEELKNGFIFSTKYEGGCKLITTPHIWVFSNKLPDTEKMSSDRWRIWKVHNNELVNITKQCFDEIDIDEEIELITKCYD